MTPRPCTDAQLVRELSAIGDALTAPFRRALKLLTDGASKIVHTSRSTSRAVLIAATTLMAEIESPPTSKKESSTPIRSRPSVWA
ncbi:Uncharacterised protein [Mycobacteroides abscessus subsp. abscessus]|nr:Uncharacterised protein [Mycobacteroides abscessus subsp. abscessus]